MSTFDINDPMIITGELLHPEDHLMQFEDDAEEKLGRKIVRHPQNKVTPHYILEAADLRKYRYPADYTGYYEAIYGADGYLDFEAYKHHKDPYVKMWARDIHLDFLEWKNGEMPQFSDDDVPVFVMQWFGVKRRSDCDFFGKKLHVTWVDAPSDEDFGNVETLPATVNNMAIVEKSEPLDEAVEFEPTMLIKDQEVYVCSLNSAMNIVYDFFDEAEDELTKLRDFYATLLATTPNFIGPNGLVSIFVCDALIRYLKELGISVALYDTVYHEILYGDREEQFLNAQYVIVSIPSHCYSIRNSRFQAWQRDTSRDLARVHFSDVYYNGMRLSTCVLDAYLDLLALAGKSEFAPYLVKKFTKSLSGVTISKRGYCYANIIICLMRYCNLKLFKVSAVIGTDYAARLYNMDGVFDQFSEPKGFYVMCRNSHCYARNNTEDVCESVGTIAPEVVGDADFGITDEQLGNAKHVASKPPAIILQPTGTGVVYNSTCLRESLNTLLALAGIKESYDTRYREMLTPMDTPNTTCFTAIDMIEDICERYGIRFHLVFCINGYLFELRKACGVCYVLFLNRMPNGYVILGEDNHAEAYFVQGNDKVYKIPSFRAMAAIAATAFVIYRFGKMMTVGSGALFSVRCHEGSPLQTSTENWSVPWVRHQTPKEDLLNQPANTDNDYSEQQPGLMNVPAASQSISGNVQVGSEMIVDSSTRIEGKTTQFIDSTITMTQPAHLNISTTLDDLDELHDIRTILARPVLLKEFEVGAAAQPLSIYPGATDNQPLAQFNVPYDIVRSGNKYSKMANFAHYQASSVIRIMTNANPFVSGKLWVAIAPSETGSSNTPDDVISKKGLPGITSYPGVEIDLQSSKNAELTIPWCSEYESGAPGSPTRGVVYIFALSSIRGPPNFSVSVQVYGHLTDVVLRGPTVTLPAPPKVVQGMLQGPKSDIKKPRPGIKTKSGTNLDPVASESRGTIGRVAGVVSDVCQVLNDIPVISSVSKPVQWISDIVEGVANVFGWSKPINGSGSDPVVNIPGRGMAQTLGEDASVVLGYSNDNQLGNANVFLTDEDEMDVQYICQRKGVVGVCQYTTSKVNQFVYMVASLEPRNVRDISIDGQSLSQASMTCGEYLASLCTHWRADIVFHISVAKTAFHAGRIEIILVPTKAGWTRDSTDFSNCYRTILDLSKQSEIEFVIPYVSRYEMTRYDPRACINNPNQRAYLVIRPLTPLMCPETVSQTVDVVVWKSARNVTLAGTMRAPFYATTMPAVSQIAGELQGGVGVEENRDVFVCYGKENTVGNALDVAQRVCGEVLTNARLLTRASRFLMPISAGTTILSCSVQSGDKDFLGYLGGMYAYWRGGFSFKVLSETQNVGVLSRLVNAVEETDYTAMSTFHVTRSNVTPVHEVQVPYYSPVKRRVVGLNSNESALPSLSISTDGVSTVYRSGKDDFTFGCLIGPRIVVDKKVVAAPNWDWETCERLIDINFPGIVADTVWRTYYTTNCDDPVSFEDVDYAFRRAWFNKWVAKYNNDVVPGVEESIADFTVYANANFTCPATMPTGVGAEFVWLA